MWEGYEFVNPYLTIFMGTKSFESSQKIKIYFRFLIFLTIFFCKSYGGTISFSNFDSKIEIQSNGTPVSTGFVSVGTTDATVNSRLWNSNR